MSRKVHNKFKEHVYKEILSPIKKAKYREGEPEVDIDNPPETDEYTGRFKGKVNFCDGSWLNFKEVIKITYNPIQGKVEVDKPMYKYNYHDDENFMVFAYHSGRPEETVYKKLDSYPHHKHTGPQSNDFTEGDKEITLKGVIEQIENKF